MDENLKIGQILCDKLTGKRYRLLGIVDGFCSLCELDITVLLIVVIDFKTIVDFLYNKEYSIEDCEQFVFDFQQLPEEAYSEYIKRKNMVKEVVSRYAPLYEELSSAKSKADINEIIQKYGYPRNTFWRICRKYFQSGFADSSLVDTKRLKTIKRKKYSYTKKAGTNPKYFEKTGVIVDSTIERYFEEALTDYKSGRAKSMRTAFDKMNKLHFTRMELINGVSTLVLLPESERPTMRQFSYYVNKKITPEEKDRIKTSAQEQRNNKRLLISDSLKDVSGPGDMIEIDAVEADVSLVSELDRNQTVGRPVVYFMIDVYTRCIVAMSVAFDNNSVLALTNLFLNLCDDKQEYCKRFGISFENSELWPSNFIPNRIRIDRGSDFKSKDFDRICAALGIEKQIVSGGTGSLKGVVEQSFHQMHSQQNVHLENYGLIEKRYDSNHHKEATLTIHEYTKMVINFVLFHNQQYNEKYHVTKDMIAKQIMPIPAVLFKYGVNKYGQPRPIMNKAQYLFELLTPVNAKISKKGINYDGLWYLPQGDTVAVREMFEAGAKKKPFEVRIDKRNVGAVYYKRDGQLITAILNPQITGNFDYDGMTWKEYEDFKKGKKLMDAKGRVHNEQLSSYLYSVDESIVNLAKKDSYSSDKNIKESREEQKQLVSKENNIAKRLNNLNQTIETDSAKLLEKVESKDNNNKNEEFKTYSSWEEAMDDFNENF